MEISLPVTEPANAVSKIAPGFVPWVDDDIHIDLGVLFPDQLAEMLGEAIVFAKGVVIPMVLS